MRKGIRGKIAGLLAAVLLGTTIVPGSVIAEDITSETTMDSVSDVEDSAGDGLKDIQDNDEDKDVPEQPAQDSDSSDESAESTQQNDEENSEGEQRDSVVASQGLVNYVGVVEPYLQAPAEQQIVLSYGDGTESISDAKIICEKADGNTIELDLDVRENEVYLFKRVFEEKDAGVYRLARFVYVQDGQEAAIELPEIGIEALFGVNEDYTGYQAVVAEEAGISAEELDTSVVTVDLNAIDNVESDIEEAIEETVEIVENEESSSKKSSKKVSQAKDSVLSSIANLLLPAATAKAAENVVVVLDPGHGGSDSGASANGLVEKNLNLSVALACKKELEEYNGVTVYMTRDTDVYVGLKERADKAKAWGADIFVSLHMNSASAGTANGVEVYYPNSNYNPDVHEDGRKLAAQIQQQLVSLGLGNRNIKEDPSSVNQTYPDGSRVDGYQVIRYNKLNGIPGIIVEHAFLTNSSDAAKLRDPNFVNSLGVADATGIANYFNLSKGVSVKIENKDDFDGVAQIKVTGLGRNAKVKVSADVNGKIKEYSVAEGKATLSFSIKDFDNVRGKYYIEALNSSGGVLYKMDFYVSKDISSTISGGWVDNKEAQYKLTTKFADMPSEVKNVRFAVWSDKGGQDDLIWYEGKQSPSGTWATSVDIKKHLSAGKYYVDVYATLSNGNVKYLTSTSFNVSVPTLSITVSDYRENEGAFDVILTNVQPSSSVEMVQVPVWCASNQSDIRWYVAKKQSDGSYKATVNIANHNYATGPYKIHTYVTTVNGIRSYTGAAPDKTVTLPDMKVVCSDTNGKEMLYTLGVSNTGMFGAVRSVQFATWSAQGGQDDIVWYQGTKGANDSWTATADIRKHKTAGKYFVHVYATLTNGGMKYLGSTEFTVSVPTSKVTVSDYREKEGAFDVILTDVQSVSKVDKVQVPVWTTSNQSDIRWYGAEKQSDGSYKATVNIANHNYATGPYKIHTYITTENGLLTGTGAAPDKMVTLPELEVSWNDTNGKETLYALKVTNTGTFGVIRSVQFATWSAQGGQDDIVWYQGTRGANDTWVTTADIRKHKTAGKYFVHVYATLTNGNMKYLGSTTFVVTTPKSTVTVSDYREKEGAFDVIITDVEPASRIEKVQVPVWTTSNQSDIRWYGTEKQKDGSYKATVNIANHNYAVGPYKIHTYVTTENGVLAGTGAAPEKMVTLPEAEVSWSARNNNGMLFDLKVTNTDMFGAIRNVQFATWSEDRGQDDIVWYQGIRGANGTWTATADIKKHKTAGKYFVHVYATLSNGNMKYLGSTNFNVIFTSIMGESQVTVDQMVKYYKSRGAKYPADAFGGIGELGEPGGAPTIEDFCQIYFEEAKAEGVKAEVAFAQAMHETGWLQYGGIVRVGQYNFGGLGALDGNSTGDCASFKTVREGVRAQIQHLKAYASTEKLNNACVDPRFKYVKRGCAPYVEYLGKKENPEGLGWATAVNYGYIIVDRIKELKAM